MTAIRCTVLPQGVPELIHKSPEDYGALNFKVAVDQAAIDHVRQIYINSEHVVFDLVPPALGAVIEECYTRIGSPPVTQDSVWTVYSTLLRTLQLHDHIQIVLSNVNEPLEEDNEPEIGLLPGLQELQENDEGYMGGVANGLGFQMEHPDALDDSELEVEDALDDSNPDPGDRSFSDNEDAI